MNEMIINGRTYQVLPNGDHYTVVNEKGFPMVAVRDPAEAEERLRLHLERCDHYLKIMEDK